MTHFFQLFIFKCILSKVLINPTKGRSTNVKILFEEHLACFRIFVLEKLFYPLFFYVSILIAALVGEVEEER